MRSGLQPVAISCNKNSYHDRFAPPVDARARSENASAASNVLRRPILCKKTNFVELAFYVVYWLEISKREMQDGAWSHLNRDGTKDTRVLRALRLPNSPAALLGAASSSKCGYQVAQWLELRFRARLVDVGLTLV